MRAPSVFLFRVCAEMVKSDYVLLRVAPGRSITSGWRRRPGRKSPSDAISIRRSRSPTFYLSYKSFHSESFSRSEAGAICVRGKHGKLMRRHTDSNVATICYANLLPSFSFLFLLLHNFTRWRWLVLFMRVRFTSCNVNIFVVAPVLDRYFFLL